MDSVTVVLWIIAIIGIIVAIIVKKNMTQVVGFAGEYWVQKELNRLPGEYLFLSDVMLEIDGKTTQIDHIVFSKYGIFVIETKQRNTYITGNEHDKYWIVKAGRKKHYMYNPIHQNYGHKKAIEQILGLEDKQVIDIVCVSGQANLRVKSNKVVRVERLVDRILFEKEEKIEDYVSMAHRINAMNIVDKKYRKQHIEDIKENINNNTEELRKEVVMNRCPRCGNELVIRKGKTGEFVGCLSFPKCRYTKEIKKSNTEDTTLF
jgi:hypothetical protein